MRRVCDHPRGTGTVCDLCGEQVDELLLDVVKRAEPFLAECPRCDMMLGAACVCPPEDFRTIMSELVDEVLRLRALLEGEKHG